MEPFITQNLAGELIATPLRLVEIFALHVGSGTEAAGSLAPKHIS